MAYESGMIVREFPSKRKTVFGRVIPMVQGPRPHDSREPHLTEQRPNENDRKRAKQFNISPEEFVRRDNIVRSLFLDCDFKVGEMVRPKMEEAYNQYGLCKVGSIFKSYHDFPTAEAMEWPKDSIPYIITLHPEKPDKDGEPQVILATKNFLKPKAER